MSHNKFKVIVVMGTRPEAIKMCPLVYELRDRDDLFDTVVLVSGQHREMLFQILDFFRIEADYDLQLMEPDQSLTRLTAKALPAIDEVIKEEKPDLLLVQGDTTTSFVASLAAFYRNVSIGHVEAGLRTNKKYYPFPEEINRKLISAVCDINFAPTLSASENLRREGVDEGKIHVTGNTVIDALFHVLKKNEGRDRSNLNGFRQVLLTAHRRENFGKPMERICQAVRDIVSEYDDVRFVFPVHKNPNVRKEVNKWLNDIDRVSLIEPADYVDFVKLMNESYFILTDSGGVQEEAPSLGKPVLVLRNETERPEAVEAGTVKIIGTSYDSIMENSRLLLDNPDEYTKMANAINPYGDGTSCKRIVDLIVSSFVS